MSCLTKMLSIALLLPLAGCMTDSAGDSAGLDQLAAEAAAMGKADLEAMVAKYKGMIAEKVNVADKLKARLKDIPLVDMMGEKAQTMKTDLNDTMVLVSQLKEKLAVYTGALKALQE